MSGMVDLAIDREIVIDAPADVVWRTITEPEQIEQWFADHVELDVRPGGAGTFVFDNRGGDRVVTVPVVVEAVDPPHRLAFRWSHPEGRSPVAGNSMLVEFLLTVEGAERTRLRVVETGIEEVQWPDDEKARYAEDHRRGWSVHMGRLADRLGGARA
ncbi:MAG TPA: SRPBCC domain-containing protein [Acidimicrobiales bacterium]|nr:SRPBCC domain-containing protein [Acidimicrobiales bacterium]